MDTLKRLDEYISAMMDGELSEHDAGLALAALTEPQGRLAWRAYHLIGDVLRSDASGAELGEGFNSRLAARLDVEVPPAVGHAAPAVKRAPVPVFAPAPPVSATAASAASAATTATATAAATTATTATAAPDASVLTGAVTPGR